MQQITNADYAFSDSDINCQLGEHTLPAAFDIITKWHSFWDIRVLMNSMRSFIQRHHGNLIKNYIRNELKKRFAETKGE